MLICENVSTDTAGLAAYIQTAVYQGTANNVGNETKFKRKYFQNKSGICPHAMIESRMYEVKWTSESNNQHFLEYLIHDVLSARAYKPFIGFVMMGYHMIHFTT